jgi:hypothetical protein
MLKRFTEWLETFLFLIGVTYFFKIISLTVFHTFFPFFEAFGITVFVINVLGILSQLYRTWKSTES